MTREEIKQKMEELTDKYVQTRNREIIEELYKLAVELERLEKESPGDHKTRSPFVYPHLCGKIRGPHNNGNFFFKP
jgi:hypothetical protein